MGELTRLPNIGPTMEAQLNQAGVFTAEQLRELGSREAWLRIQQFDPSACYNRLCGLEGALQGMRWHRLDDKTKADLKEFYQIHCK